MYLFVDFVGTWGLEEYDICANLFVKSRQTAKEKSHANDKRKKQMKTSILLGYACHCFPSWVHLFAKRCVFTIHIHDSRACMHLKPLNTDRNTEKCIVLTSRNTVESLL